MPDARKKTQESSSDVSAASDKAAALCQENARLRKALQESEERSALADQQRESADRKLQVSNSELRTLNSDLQSANRNLQSANENLRTTSDRLDRANQALNDFNAVLDKRNAELTQAREDLANLINSTRMPVVLLSHDLVVRHATAAAEEVLGITQDNLSRPLAQLSLSVAVPNLHGMLEKAISDGTAFEHEVQDSGGRWYSARIHPYIAAGAKIDGAVLSLTDITELKQTQQALDESRQRLQAILDNTAALVYIKDRDGRFILVNNTLARHLQHSENEIIGKTDHDFFPTGFADEYRENDMRVFESGKPQTYEESYRVFGLNRTLLSVKVPLRDKDGAVYALCGISTDITDLKRAQLLVERYAGSVVQTAPVAVITIDAAGRIQRANRYATELTGYTEDEMKGLNWLDFLVNPEEGDRLISMVAEAYEGKIQQGTEVAVRAKDGRRLIMRWYSALQYDEQGAPENLVAVGVDVTEMRRKEEELEAARRETEALARLPLENPGPVLRVDTDGKVLYSNPAGRLLLSAWKADVGGRLPEEYCRLITQVYQRQEMEIIEVALEDHFFSVTFTPAAGAGYVNLYGRDITELKLAERELRESRTRLAEAQSIAHIGNWQWMIESGDLIWSDEVYRVFARKPGEFPPTYERFLQCVHPDDRQAVQDAVNHSVSTGERYSIEHRVIRPNGEIRFVHEQGEVFRSEAGIPVRMAGTVQDITERVQLEEQLRQAAKMEAIGRLAGGVAHDFNNYLTAIRGFASLLQAEPGLDDGMRYSLEQIQKAADRSAALTRQLLAVGRRTVIRKEMIDLNSALEDLAKSLRHMLGEHIELAIRPAQDQPKVRADRSQLHQVILNLVINARDAMPDGGTVTITTQTTDSHPPDAEPGRYVLLSISDTGTGISGELLPHIFEPFYTTREAQGGTGLGLATVHGIITQSGGYVSVESSPGEGSTFKVYLPAVMEEADVSERSKKPETIRPGSGTILVVEDDRAVRIFVSRVLRQYGYEVIEAGTADEALALADGRSGPIDLLVSDVIMPGMNGLQLARKLRERQPGLPALFISGYTKNAIPNRDLVAADIDLLTKPFDPDELAARVQRALKAAKA